MSKAISDGRPRSRSYRILISSSELLKRIHVRLSAVLWKWQRQNRPAGRIGSTTSPPTSCSTRHSGLSGGQRPTDSQLKLCRASSESPLAFQHDAFAPISGFSARYALLWPQVIPWLASPLIRDFPTKPT